MENKENRTRADTPDNATDNSIVKRIGNTTFDIHVHFSEKSRETFTDKVIRLIQNEKKAP